MDTLLNFVRRVRLTRRSLVATCLIGLCLVSSLLAWRAALRPGQARLTGLSLPGLSRGPCSFAGPAPQTGPAVALVTEWVHQDDLVPVMRSFTAQGWRATTYMTTSIELVPESPAVVHLGVMRLRLYRGASLAYTEERMTRVSSGISVILCPA